MCHAIPHNDEQHFKRIKVRDWNRTHLFRVHCKHCDKFIGYYNPQWEKLTKSQRKRVGFGFDKGIGE